MSFRNGFYAGLLIAFALGIYLSQLWRPEKQVDLHSFHLLKALEEKSWSDVAGFVDDSYTDRWGHDRALLLTRLRAVLPFARNLHFETIAPSTDAAGIEGDWSARLRVEADENEMSGLIKARVNALDAPFHLHWRRVGKPWEWKLVRADNSEMELPDEP